MPPVDGKSGKHERLVCSRCITGRIRALLHLTEHDAEDEQPETVPDAEHSEGAAFQERRGARLARPCRNLPHEQYIGRVVLKCSAMVWTMWLLQLRSRQLLTTCTFCMQSCNTATLAIRTCRTSPEPRVGHQFLGRVEVRVGCVEVHVARTSAHPQLEPLPDGGVPITLAGPCLHRRRPLVSDDAAPLRSISRRLCPALQLNDVSWRLPRWRPWKCCSVSVHHGTAVAGCARQHWLELQRCCRRLLCRQLDSERAILHVCGAVCHRLQLSNRWC